MELKIGTLLTLEPTYTDCSEKFRCRIVESENNIIFIDYPINVMTNKTAFLVDGAQFRVTFSNEQRDSYCFNTEVLGRRGGDVQMIMMSCPPVEDFIKIQRREYVRVETPVDVAVEHNNRFYQLVAEDISAGGIAVQLKSPVGFNEGEYVKLVVVLPFANGDMRYVETEANVVRIFEREDVKVASIQFTNTDDIDQQHIVRFCFERQLMIRKKELNKI
jgi:c-di-GMP-binding flagellar brake protein YcgR